MFGKKRDVGFDESSRLLIPLRTRSVDACSRNTVPRLVLIVGGAKVIVAEASDWSRVRGDEDVNKSS